MTPVRAHLSLARVAIGVSRKYDVELTEIYRVCGVGKSSCGSRLLSPDDRESTLSRNCPKESGRCSESISNGFASYTTDKGRSKFASEPGSPKRSSYEEATSVGSGAKANTRSLIPLQRPPTSQPSCMLRQQVTIFAVSNSCPHHRQVASSNYHNEPGLRVCTKSTTVCGKMQVPLSALSSSIPPIGRTNCQIRDYFSLVSQRHGPCNSNKCNILSNSICDLERGNYRNRELAIISRTQIIKPNAMLSNVLTRFKSTLQNDGELSGGIASNDISEEEKLLSNSKGNKRITINACGNLYIQLAKSRPDLFASAPIGKGINFELNYFDSIDLLNCDEEVRTICLLHGAPGRYQEFASQINFFVKKGFRVVAPNFPDYSATLNHSFRHSPPERLDLLLEFFKAIQVNQIDMLVGHSSAIYTIMELLENSFKDKSKWPIKIKSLGLFSTPTYNLPSNLAPTPLRLFTLRLFDYPLLRPIIVSLIHTFVKFQGIRNRVDKDKIENLLIAASAMGYSNSEKTRDQLTLVRCHKVPTYVVIGCNDKLIPMRSFEQLKCDLGIVDDGQIKQYDKMGDLRQDIKRLNEQVEVSQFDTGGHYAFQRYANQVNGDMMDFLTRKVSIKMVNEVVTKL